jgi:hypothetical protein
MGTIPAMMERTAVTAVVVAGHLAVPRIEQMKEDNAEHAVPLVI